MNKLVKTILFAAAFAFVAGCANKPVAPAPAPTVKAVKAHHPSKHCKGHKCREKLGASVDSDTAK